MRGSLTAVLERNATLSGAFATEPYEAAWAIEARWFVHTLQRHGDDTRIHVVTQVSPDGLHWCDLDESRDLGETGLATWPSTNFGGWLRVSGRVLDTATGADATAKVMITLALKA